MTKLVLSVHVLAAIVIIGSLAVATSLFPSAVRRAARGEGRRQQQRRALALVEAAPRAGAGDFPGIGRLTVAAGLFNVIWAVVTVLIIVRPGSTTGA